MNFKFYTTFRFLKVVGNDFDDFDLLPGLTLVRDRAKIRKVLTKNIKDFAGIIEYDHLYNANHIIYADLKDEFFPPSLPSGDALLGWILWIDMLVSTSWLIKDNGILCEIAYCNKSDRRNYSEWSNNSLMSMFTFSNGDRHTEVEFTREDLINWEKKNHKIQTYLYNNSSTVFDTFLDSKYSRYGRALSFIKSAKREYDPAMKIAHYCSALESLFSTDSAELSHKLSERVAIFLKPYGFDPLKTFDEIKSFYNIRSKVTHGDSLKSSKLENIPDESKKLDGYLRVIMNEILESEELMTIFNGKKEGLEMYFKSKILLGVD
jgi:hypothetical protein